MEDPIGIAGGGRLGQALGRLLYECGEPVACVACRTSAHAGAAARYIGRGVVPVTYEDMSRHASRFLISVPDSALEETAARLSASRGVALHTSGTRGPDALHSLWERGVSCGALHPLQTVPDPDAGVAALRGIAFAVSGGGAAAEWAADIVQRLDGRILRIDPANRPLYHAAAVVAGNYVIALLAAAESLMVAAGVAPSEALPALAPLARTSLENALTLGPGAAITGPVARGDVSTVDLHLAALADAEEPVRNLYRAAGLLMLGLARTRGLDHARAVALEQMLR